MKKNILNLSLILFFSLVFIGCDDDDTITRDGKPTIQVVQANKTVDEGTSAIYEFNVEYPINESIFIRIDVLGSDGRPIPTTEPIGDSNSGNGYAAIVLDDISVPYNTWFDSGFFSFGYIGGSGYVAEIPPYTTDFQLSIDALLDNVLNEAQETYRFRLTGTSTAAAVINENLSMTIRNINACAWTLETIDDFGDGWNGGFITATVNGVETQYAASGTGTTFEIGMVEDDIYSFTYTSGGGTGGAPGWESENTYVLTAPDGTTQFSGGPIPDVGLITSGTNQCTN